jgi:hypothetical protein
MLEPQARGKFRNRFPPLPQSKRDGRARAVRLAEH